MSAFESSEEMGPPVSEELASVLKRSFGKKKFFLKNTRRSFFNRGDTEGTNSSEILCSKFVYVFFYVNLCQDFVIWG